MTRWLERYNEKLRNRSKDSDSIVWNQDDLDFITQEETDFTPEDEL